MTTLDEPVRPTGDRIDDREVHNVPGPSYDQRLDQDRYPVPAILRERPPWPEGLPREIPRERYVSREIHDLEVTHMWMRVWQMACRADQLREVGDSVLYEIADRSYIVVRSDPDTIRAFPNTCLHRGRALRTCDGPVARLRCPYHGFTWNLDGTLKEIPARWDYPGLPDTDLTLPEARVGTWGGLVFINPDPDAAPFAEHIAEFDRHFQRNPLDSWTTRVHAAKTTRCNWKLMMEAFLEASHVYATHPQATAGTDGCNAQNDMWPNMSRILMPMGVSSVLLPREPSEQQKLDGMMGRKTVRGVGIDVPEGALARHVFADIQRGRLQRAGIPVELCDSEVTDLLTYWLFPNLLVLGGARGTVFRFRPGPDPDTCTLEVIGLNPPRPGKEPPPVPDIKHLGPDDEWSSEPLLADYELVDQDMGNPVHCHAAIRNLPDRPVLLSAYQEAPIAHFHKILYEEWLDGRA